MAMDRNELLHVCGDTIVLVDAHLMCDLSVHAIDSKATAHDTVINAKTHNPGSSPVIVTNMKQSMQRLGAVSISGYSSIVPRGLGMSFVTNIPNLSFMYLEALGIEVDAHRHHGGMLLPHDPIISLVVFNGGWYDKEFDDKCHFLYTLGTCNNIDWASDKNCLYQSE